LWDVVILNFLTAQCDDAYSLTVDSAGGRFSVITLDSGITGVLGTRSRSGEVCPPTLWKSSHGSQSDSRIFSWIHHHSCAKL